MRARVKRHFAATCRRLPRVGNFCRIIRERVFVFGRSQSLMIRPCRHINERFSADFVTFNQSGQNKFVNCRRQFRRVDLPQREQPRGNDLFPTVETTVIVRVHNQAVKGYFFKRRQLVNLFRRTDCFLDNPVRHFALAPLQIIFLKQAHPQRAPVNV